MKSITATADGNQSQISRYVQPYAHSHLATIYMESNKFDLAADHLSMAKSFTHYEFRSRLQAQLRSLQRKLEFKIQSGSEDTYL